MKLTPEDIRAAHRALETVQSIDNDITALGRADTANLNALGKKVREVVGRNLTGHFTDERLGSVVHCAMVNELLRKRQDVASSASDLMEFPAPPCEPIAPQTVEVRS